MFLLLKKICLTRFDDRIVFRRQITNDFHVPLIRKCIRIDYDPYVKLFLTGFPVLLPQWLHYGK